MTPAARVAAAIDILGLVDALGRPADRVVDRWYQGHRFAGSKDRAAINAMVYGVLRQRAKLAWIIEKCGNRQLVGPRLLVLAQLVLDRGEDQSCVKALFDSSRFGPPALEQHELDLLAAIRRYGARPTDLPGWVDANCPEWLFHEVLGYLGDATGAEFAAMQRRPPLDLRVNTLKATPEEAARALAEENVVAERCPHASTGLRIAGRASVLGTRAYRDGLVEVQDEGSQVAAALVQAQPGQTVIDLCAGAGGKSLALAAAQMNWGVIHACDVNGSRLRRMAPRLRRAGVSIVEAHEISGAGDPWFTGHLASADRVLIDAPCTGTGTIRRNPDLAWRLSPADTERNVSMQRALLARAADLVRPGGRLVYATCSLLEAENEQRVAEFLSEHPNFGPVPVGEVWTHVLDSPAPRERDCVLLTPRRYGTDGFFIAILERRE